MTANNERELPTKAPCIVAMRSASFMVIVVDIVVYIVMYIVVDSLMYIVMYIVVDVVVDVVIDVVIDILVDVVVDIVRDTLMVMARMHLSDSSIMTPQTSHLNCVVIIILTQHFRTKRSRGCTYHCKAVAKEKESKYE